jgi:DNA-binding transcriptional ArsR family regulator
MSAGIETIPKILKDPTRRQAIKLLKEYGALTYTELMDALNIVSTGTLNYHLKVLGDLLIKNDSGKYVLSEKGETALRMLQLFSAENDVQLQKRRQKRFWAAAAIGQVIYFASALTLYSLEYLNVGNLVTFTIWFFGGLVLAYLGYRMQDKPLMLGSEDERRRFMIVYPMAGATVGLLVCFLGPVIVSTVSFGLGGPNLIAKAHIEDALLIITVAVALGAVLGYWMGRITDFRKPKWMIKSDEKFGF